MALKMTGVTGSELSLLAKEMHLHPAFTDETCYIASSPENEILAVQQADGLFDVQVLDKGQAAISVNETIRAFQQFVQQRTGGQSRAAF